MSFETKLGLAATTTAILGTASFFAPERTPQDWSFVHQNANSFHIAGIALWVATGLTTLALSSILMNQKGWVAVDPLAVSIVSPTPRGIEAGRRDDARRLRRARLTMARA